MTDTVMMDQNTSSTQPLDQQPQEEQESMTPTTPAREEVEAEIPHSESNPQPNEQQKRIQGVSFSIWPPTQRTRDAVLNRLIETLSSPSVLSKRYGSMPPDEATVAARRIEGEAFVAAGSSASGEEDGIEILQVYSKEISKRMLEAVKSRSASALTPAKDSDSPTAAPASATPGEEISSVETNES